jgi:hypothetical protein
MNKIMQAPCAAAMLLLSPMAGAQAYPAKTVRILAYGTSGVAKYTKVAREAKIQAE